jgi:hypothetical protein
MINSKALAEALNALAEPTRYPDPDFDQVLSDAEMIAHIKGIRYDQK